MRSIHLSVSHRRCFWSHYNRNPTPTANIIPPRRLRHELNPQNPNRPRVTVPGTASVGEIPLHKIRSDQLDRSQTLRCPVVVAATPKQSGERTAVAVIDTAPVVHGNPSVVI